MEERDKWIDEIAAAGGIWELLLKKASLGEIDNVKELLEQSGCDENSFDYNWITGMAYGILALNLRTGNQYLQAVQSGEKGKDLATTLEKSIALFQKKSVEYFSKIPPEK